MSFQNTFRNTNSSSSSSSSAREYFTNYNNNGTGLSTITSAFYYIFGMSNSSPQVSNTSSNSGFYLDLESLGVSCVCDESNCDLRN